MDEPVTKRRPMFDMEEFERRLRQYSGNQPDDPIRDAALQLRRWERERLSAQLQEISFSGTGQLHAATLAGEAQNLSEELTVSGVNERVGLQDFFQVRQRFAGGEKQRREIQLVSLFFQFSLDDAQRVIGDFFRIGPDA